MRRSLLKVILALNQNLPYLPGGGLIASRAHFTKWPGSSVGRAED
jgi:hypothetical protein